MGAVARNILRGTIRKVEVSDDKKTSQVTTDAEHDDFERDDRFEIGILRTTGRGNPGREGKVDFRVVGSGIDTDTPREIRRARGKTRVYVVTVENRVDASLPGRPKLIVPTVGAPFELFDDDFRQDGQDLPEVDTRALPAALAEAYVEYVRNTVPADTVPTRFIANVPHTYGGALDAQFEHPELDVDPRDNWQTGPVNSPVFWCAYILGAFQPEPGLDYDPSWSGQTVFGSTSASGGCLIYLETIRDYAGFLSPVPVEDFEQTVVVHELGHHICLLQTGEHPVTVREEEGDPNTPRYVPRYINFIRSAFRPADRRDEP
jgi:hypothetical protein